MKQSKNNLCRSVLFLCFILLAVFIVVPNHGQAAKKKTKIILPVKSIKTNGVTYLLDKKNRPVQGWFILMHGNYYALKDNYNLGFYDTKYLKLVYANTDGSLPQNETLAYIPFDAKGYPSKANGMFWMNGNFYFIKKGYLQTKDITYQGVKYHINLAGVVTHLTKGNKNYKPNWRKLSKTKLTELTTREYCRIVIQKCCKKKMTQKQRLNACFKWIIDNRTYGATNCNGKKGWTSKLTVQMFRTGTGDCRLFATAFAFLASEIGYKDASLCQNHKGRYGNTHCWTRAGGLYYDPYYYQSSLRKPRYYKNAFNGSTPKQFYKELKCRARQKFKPGA